MNVNQLSWVPLSSKALSSVTLLSRYLKDLKSALQKSRTVILFFVLLHPLTILNSTILWSLQPRLPLAFPFPVSPTFFVSVSRAFLLTGFFITWIRKLSLMLSRILLHCLCPAVLSLRLVEVSSRWTRTVNVRLLQTLSRKLD